MISHDNSAPAPSPRGGAAPLAGMPLKDGVYSILALRRFPELVHGVSTRFSPDGGDWNMSILRGSPKYPPDLHVALAHREQLAARLGIRVRNMVGVQQVHGDEIAVVGPDDAGRGMHPDRLPIQGTDAMITNTPGLYMMVLGADCPPVFIYDPVRRVAGLAHSGWKGTVGHISAKVVETMQRRFGTQPEDVVAAVGPGIGPCCYKVGSNVVEAAEGSFSQPWRPTRYGPPLLEVYEGEVYFNLWEGIRRSLIEAGVPKLNITIEGMCTMHNTGIFYSHRGEAGKCGLFGAVLGMRAETRNEKRET